MVRRATVTAGFGFAARLPLLRWTHVKGRSIGQPHLVMRDWLMAKAERAHGSESRFRTFQTGRI